MEYAVLIVSSYPNMRLVERSIFQERGNIPSQRIHEAESIEAASRTLDVLVKNCGKVAVVADIRVSGVNGRGLKLLDMIKAEYPSSVQVIMTSSSEPEQYTSDVKDRGAFAYVQKGDFKELLTQVRSALEQQT